MKMTALVGIIALTAFSLTASAAEPTTATKPRHHVNHHRTRSQVRHKDPLRGSRTLSLVWLHRLVPG